MTQGLSSKSYVLDSCKDILMIITQVPSAVPVCLPFLSSHAQSSYVW